MKQLTISVAAYNVEAYLDQLMESIINADVMDSLEVLIINDGSCDHTAEIAMRYQERYPQSVRLINKPNGGHGSTINRGIQEATGKYFRALDGDDWIHSDHLAALIRKMDLIEADLILTNFGEYFEDKRRILEDQFSELKDGETHRFEEIWHPGLRMNYHTIIFRTALLQEHRIRLDEHCFYVDTEYMLYPIPFVETIYYSKDHIYCYRRGMEGQSVSKTSRMKNIHHSEAVGKDIISFYDANKGRMSKEKRQYCIDAITIHCKWHEQSIMFFRSSRKQRQEFMDFDQYVSTHAPEVYEQMGHESKILYVLRRFHYHPYAPVAAYSIKRDERWQKKQAKVCE